MSDKKFKSIHYSYPSSPYAKSKGHGDTGCYHIEIGDRMDIDPSIVFTSSSLALTIDAACRRPEPFMDIGGHICNGTQFIRE